MFKVEINNIELENFLSFFMETKLNFLYNIFHLNIISLESSLNIGDELTFFLQNKLTYKGFITTIEHVYEKNKTEYIYSGTNKISEKSEFYLDKDLTFKKGAALSFILDELLEYTNLNIKIAPNLVYQILENDKEFNKTIALSQILLELCKVFNFYYYVELDNIYILEYEHQYPEKFETKEIDENTNTLKEFLSIDSTKLSSIYGIETNNKLLDNVIRLNEVDNSHSLETGEDKKIIKHNEILTLNEINNIVLFNITKDLIASFSIKIELSLEEETKDEFHASLMDEFLINHRMWAPNPKKLYLVSKIIDIDNNKVVVKLIFSRGLE